ncbi:MAG TPA: hypothetical protein VLM11_22485 [Streptosporangiaceae bacterium]|nr:hypothetical protein [Streptosporangiaceae bacterium]
MTSDGRDALDATIGVLHKQFPGFVLTLAGPVAAHHRQARFTWGLGPAGAKPLVLGFDIAVTDDQNKIVSVLGFLDKVPSWHGGIQSSGFCGPAPPRVVDTCGTAPVPAHSDPIERDLGEISRPRCSPSSYITRFIRTAAMK